MHSQSTATNRVLDMAGMSFMPGVAVQGVRAPRMAAGSFRAEFDRMPALQQALAAR